MGSGEDGIEWDISERAFIEDHAPRVIRLHRRQTATRLWSYAFGSFKALLKACRVVVIQSDEALQVNQLILKNHSLKLGAPKVVAQQTRRRAAGGLALRSGWSVTD